MIFLKILFFLLVAVHMVLTKPLEASSNYTTSAIKFQLLQYYNNEINNLSRTFCIKFKNISDQILKDDVIQQAKTPIIQEFKRNITQFQEIYPSYMRFGLNKQLLTIFAETTIEYYYQDPTADNDSQYILQLIKKLGYDEVLDEYESEFMNFAFNKFLPKLEEFKSYFSSHETNQWQGLLKWVEELKECKIYECFYTNFIRFDKTILTPKEQLYAFIKQKMNDISLFIGNATLHVTKSMLENPKLQLLSLDMKQQLVENLNEFIRKYESNSNVNQVSQLLKLFHQTVLLKFVGNEGSPTKDSLILKEIFLEAGYAQIEKIYENKLKDFVESFKGNDSQKTLRR